MKKEWHSDGSRISVGEEGRKGVGRKEHCLPPLHLPIFALVKCHPPVLPLTAVVVGP